MNQPLYGPPAINGTPQQGIFVEMAFNYIYNVTLTANQFLQNQAVPIDTDADFEIRAIALTAGTGFSWRIQDSSAQYRFSGLVDWALFQVAGNSNIMPMFPSILIPAGGRIGVDIQETAAAVSTVVQIVFMGVKRFATPVAIRR